MAIVSYAQNFEDVMLARAFPGADGFYVDVGANGALPNAAVFGFRTKVNL